jgi:hypothetical protein
MNKSYEVIYREYPYNPENTKKVVIKANTTEKAYQIFLKDHPECFITTFTKLPLTE